MIRKKRRIKVHFTYQGTWVAFVRNADNLVVVWEVGLLGEMAVEGLAPCQVQIRDPFLGTAQNC